MDNVKREVLERELLSQPVRGLQYMLGQLSRVYKFLPQLVPDGIFGERTLEAVMLFQREFHPPVTGIVDRGTWNAIRDRWQQMEEGLAPAQGLRGFPAGECQVKPGTSQIYMIVPQVMFRVLSQKLNGIVPCSEDGYNGPETEENVRWLQKAADLPETGIMNQRTWNVLCRLYEIFVVYDRDTARPEFSGGWG